MRLRLSELAPVCAVILFVCFVEAVGLAHAQECTVSTTVRVLDKHSQSVENVTASQLRAEVNGGRARVSSFVPAKPTVILMLDASASMRGAWRESIAAALGLVGKAGDDIDTFVFDEAIQGHALGRAKSEKLLEQWSKETPRHATAVYDTLIEVAGRVTNRNAAIVLITDGEDDASTHTSEATESQFLRSSWPLVFVLIVDSGRAAPHRGDLKKLSAATGGLVAHPKSASKVAAAMDELAGPILGSFALTLQPSGPVSPGAKLKLEILGANGKPRGDVHAVYPGQVAGCDSRSNTTPAPQ